MKYKKILDKNVIKSIRAKCLNGHVWYRTPVAFNLEPLQFLWGTPRRDLKHHHHTWLWTTFPPCAWCASNAAKQIFNSFMRHTVKEEVLSLHLALLS